MKRLDISTGELLEALIDGKLEDWNKLDFKIYLEENGLDNEESLRLLLEEIDNKIGEFHDSFFISEYDKYQHGVGEYPKEVTREFEDYLDSLYHDETGWEQAGKKRYTLDTLYRLMNERGLFFNEAHECAVNKAYEEKNCELLKHFYEEYVLRNVQEFRDHVKGMLGDEEKPDNGDVKEGTGKNLLKCELTNKQMALICFYRKIPVNNELKASAIYKEFGCFNKQPRKLQNDYSKIKFFANRTGADGTKADSAKITNFEVIIEYFKKRQKKVPDELLADFELLKENVEKYRYNK